MRGLPTLVHPLSPTDWRLAGQSDALEAQAVAFAPRHVPSAPLLVAVVVLLLVLLLVLAQRRRLVLVQLVLLVWAKWRRHTKGSEQ